LRDETWRRLPKEWDRATPSTWQGDVGDSCHTAGLAYRRGHLKFQKGTLETDERIQRGFGAGSRPFDCVQSLIGVPLAPIYVRGLYCIIPMDAWRQLPRFINPHVEAHAMQVVAIAYLDDVALGEGAIHVWPGSHAELYGTFQNKMDYVATNRTRLVQKKHNALEGVELPGRCGDVILMHHRLFHAPSLNQSPSKIRYSLFCDYRRHDWQTLTAGSPGDMWEDWPALAGMNVSEVTDFRQRPREADPGGDRELLRPLTPSSINKSDASRIAKLRRNDDTWLVLSDNPEILASKKLLPCGSNIADAGVRVTVNGMPVASVSTNDIIAPVELKPGANEIEIRGEAPFIGLRLIRTHMPIPESRVLLRRQLTANAETPARVAYEAVAPASGQ